MRVLVTRPEPGASKTAEKLRFLGHEPVVMPLTEVVPRQAAAEELNQFDLGNLQAMVLTSANAARVLAVLGLASRFSHLPVWCVGVATAQAAEIAGFSYINCPEEAHDAAYLSQILIDQLDPGAGMVLHLRGQDHAFDVEAVLNQAGIIGKSIVIYSAPAIEKFPKFVGEALTNGEIDAVLHYSPRAAERFFALTGPVEPTIWMLCLSEQVAAMLGNDKHRTDRIIVASAPTEEALLFCLDGLSSQQG